MRHLILFVLLAPFLLWSESALVLNNKEYFETRGLNVMVFQDYYPVGHQGGVSFIQNGKRVATNGDLRLSDDPGQWQPVPKKVDRVVDMDAGNIRVKLSYPDENQHLKGFNPLLYPDLELDYEVVVEPMSDSGFRVEVNLKDALPDEWIGKVGFNLEFFPPHLWGESFYMDGEVGLFPQQANGCIELDDANQSFKAPSLAKGSRLVIAPGDALKQVTIGSKTGELKLLDGRINHNNGWFVLCEKIQSFKTKSVIVWEVVPRANPDWLYEPVFHYSQVGYHPDQEKKVLVEIDVHAKLPETVEVFRIDENGEAHNVLSAHPTVWGEFLRYQYVVIDLTDQTKEGLYRVKYGEHSSRPIRISKTIYEGDIWQPTIEYFLPVQMCHMKVSEKYRIWHDRCHLDDALMAPTGINHFDGYVQGPDTLCDFEPLDHVPGLNEGGWHDAGDYDLRVESQINTVYNLCLAYETFDVDLDQTLIDQEAQVVEIHHPDGVPDVLQQIEHGLLSVLGGYENLGRLYRGIITPTLRQYVMLGDAASMSDNIPYDKTGDEVDLGHVWYQRISNSHSKYFDPHDAKKEYQHHAEKLDDRLVFTEENPRRSLDAIAGLAAASRVLNDYDPDLAARSLKAAEELWEIYHKSEGERIVAAKYKALVELILSTEKPKYVAFLNDNVEEVIPVFDKVGYLLGRALKYIESDDTLRGLSNAAREYGEAIDAMKSKTPFGVPYEPNIWGAGWKIQYFGKQQYFLHSAYPEFFPKENMLNALHFVLGCHPGENTASFVSGVGAESVLVAYGVNRADASFIPGGSVSGTALIRPDFPELLEWPYLWQQTEYVMGGGATNYLFLALAAREMFADE